MRRCDIILGFYWLSKYHALIDCHGRTITFSIPGKPIRKIHYDLPTKSIPPKLLANVDLKTSEPSIDQIPVVNSFKDVFQEITHLPPCREIEFSIEMIPKTKPISVTPY